MLTVSSLNVSLAGAKILRDVTFSLKPGATTVLIGRNGAGKTTLLRAIMGLTPSESGSVALDGRDLLVVEDIVDTGLTLNYLLRLLKARAPRSLKVAALLSKPSRRLVETPVDYTGFTIDDHFVVGYGLDYNERVRNMPEIGIYGTD